MQTTCQSRSIHDFCHVSFRVAQFPKIFRASPEQRLEWLRNHQPNGIPTLHRFQQHLAGIGCHWSITIFGPAFLQHQYLFENQGILKTWKPQVSAHYTVGKISIFCDMTFPRFEPSPFVDIIWSLRFKSHQRQTFLSLLVAICR